MKRLALVLVTLGACASVALAAAGDPQKKYTRAGQARAKAAGFRIADFPPGWKQQPQQKKDDSQPRCSTYNPDQSDLVEIGDYDSPDFARADGSSISSSTSTFQTVRMGRAAYARIAKPALPHCLAELFAKGTKPNPTTIFSAGPLQFPTYGDRSSAYRITGSVKTPSVRVRFALDVVVFNRGAVDAAVLMLGIGQPLASGLEQSLVAKLAARAG